MSPRHDHRDGRGQLAANVDALLEHVPLRCDARGAQDRASVAIYYDCHRLYLAWLLSSVVGRVAYGRRWAVDAPHCVGRSREAREMTELVEQFGVRVEPTTLCETAARAIEQRLAAHLLCVAFEAFNERGLA